MNFRKLFFKYERMYKVSHEMEEHYKELFHTSMGEHRFGLLQVEILKSALSEVVSMTSDPLAKKACQMALERHNLDKMIHTRLLSRK